VRHRAQALTYREDKAMNKEQTMRMAEHLQSESLKAYNLGVKDTLLALRDIYGNGIEETDLWAEYASEENK
jgi:hypothetical protein